MSDSSSERISTQVAAPAASSRTPISTDDEARHVSTLVAGAATAPIAPADRERSFLCPEPGCNGRFHRKFTLREHLKTHTGEKPYQCAIPSCGKLFSTSGNLSRHRRLHMLKRLECPILDCTRVFTKQEKLLRHLKVHMGSAAHACSFPGCTKTFSTSGNLNRHLRTQHSGRRGNAVGIVNAVYTSVPTAPQSSMVPLPPLPFMENEPHYPNATPIDIYSQSHHHHHHYHSPPAPEQREEITASDLLVLLDCLFVNESSQQTQQQQQQQQHSQIP